MWRVADYAVIFSNGKIHNFPDWSEPDLFSAKNKEMFVKSKPQSVNILKYNNYDNYDKNDKRDKYPACTAITPHWEVTWIYWHMQRNFKIITLR